MKIIKRDREGQVTSEETKTDGFTLQHVIKAQSGKQVKLYSIMA
jgi:hypothetical protein